jgi:hypothetical protein
MSMPLSRRAPIRLMPTTLLLGLWMAALAGPLQASERQGRAHRPVATSAAEASGAVGHAYRCASASGHVAYSQWPCDGGQRLNKLGDARTQAQQQASADQIERDQALSRRMARDRERLHKQAQGQTAISLGPSAGVHARRAHLAKPLKRADPHAPVPLERCTPPRCFTAKSPKGNKADS